MSEYKPLEGEGWDTPPEDKEYAEPDMDAAYDRWKGAQDEQV